MQPGKLLFALTLALTAKGATSLPPAGRLARGIALAGRGQCRLALPLLQSGLQASRHPSPAAPLTRRAAADAVRCAMLLNHPRLAGELLLQFSRMRVGDHELLYLASHVFSRLANQSAAELMRRAPGSAAARELQAEAQESQGNWQAAEADYRTLLRLYPHRAGLHYRLGRLLLSEPGLNAARLAAAHQEFLAELRLDPGNAGAEFVLGDLDFQARRWTAATRRFALATRLNPGFTDAWLGLGRSRLALGQARLAIAPLAHAARLDPNNPTPHYYLALAYLKTGHRAAAARERRLQKSALARANAIADRVKREMGAAAAPH